MPVAKNVKIMWAQIKTVDEYSGKYEITMANLDDAQVKQFKDMGVTVNVCEKEGDFNRGNFVRAKSKFQPEVFLGRDHYDGLIGNGSIGNVVFDTSTYKGKTGCRLSKIVLLDLVPYEGSDGADNDDMFAGVDDSKTVATSELVA